MKFLSNTLHKKWVRQSFLLTGIAAVAAIAIACNKKSNPSPTPEPTPTGEVEQWITRADQTLLLNKADKLLPFVTTSNTNANIEITESTTYQTVDGFGYTLTGGSAYLINSMSTTEKNNLLNELFGNSATSIGVSYLRISLGASDLSPFVFSYNDLPAGQTDETLSKFSLAADTTDLIPVLKQILTINPNIKIMASPWSPPTWMKTNGNSVGGSLQEKYYAVYAQYFVKYIQAMKGRGITIDAVTIQNEPEHGGNNPSMLMNEAQQTAFIKNNLGPAFKDAGITTKIIIWDHNCDRPNYPITVMNDPDAKKYIDGSAFHLYAGDISALSTVRNAHPDKALYFTEQWTGKNGSFDGDLKWHIRNVIIGSMRNWSRVALEWNLANNPQFGPHTPGGCTECRGALMINGDQVTRNVSYYIVAHASKFVPAGSTRIESIGPGNLAHVAFKTPAGKKVLLVLNDNGYAVNFNIKINGKWAVAQLPANAVGTYVW
jgi:glucosylceramidase